MRDELKPALEQARTAAPEELPRLLGDLEEVRATALARLTAPQPTDHADELIDIAEAARRMGMSRKYVYEHHGEFPFARRIGRKLLFSSKGLEKYISQKLRS